MWNALSLFCISHLITLCQFSSRFRGTKQTRGLKEDHIAAKRLVEYKDAPASGGMQKFVDDFIPIQKRSPFLMFCNF
jgi:hypothetical protein